MSRRRCLCLAVLGLAAVAGLAAPARALPPAGSRFALLVGINRYESPELTRLEFAEKDVTDFARVLVTRCGFPEDHVWVMTPGREKGLRPTHANIAARLQLLLKYRRPDDLVLVALCGHGLEAPGERGTCFCPVDAVPSAGKNLLTLDGMYAQLGDSAAGVKLVLFDACRSDAPAGHARGPAVRTAGGYRPTARVPDGVAVLYSCGAEQQAGEDRRLGHGIFFYHVLDGLRTGGAAAGAKQVTVGSLYAYVRERVNDVSRKDLDRPQTPVLAVEGVNADRVLFPLLGAAEGAPLLRLHGHSQDILSLALSADGTRAVSVSIDATVRVWDLEAGKELHCWKPDGGRWVCAVALSPRDGSALVGLLDGSVRLWDLNAGKELRCLRKSGAGVTSVAFTPNGKRALAGAIDGTIRQWDVKTGKERAAFTGHTQAVSAVACSPKGRLLASSSWDGTVRLWDLDSGKQERVFAGQTGMVHAVAFSPDGTQVASGGEDGRIRLWDVAGGGEGVRLQEQGPACRTVAFTRDGRHLVTGGADHQLRLWDLGDRRVVEIFAGHKGIVRCLAVSADGRQMLSGSLRTPKDDPSLLLWRLP